MAALHIFLTDKMDGQMPHPMVVLLRHDDPAFLVQSDDTGVDMNVIPITPDQVEVEGVPPLDVVLQLDEMLGSEMKPAIRKVLSTFDVPYTGSLIVVDGQDGLTGLLGSVFSDPLVFQGPPSWASIREPEDFVGSFTFHRMPDDRNYSRLSSVVQELFMEGI